MGRRKSRKKPTASRAKQKLPTTFNCLFCQEEGAIRVQIKKVEDQAAVRLADLVCSGCGIKWSTTCSPLQEAIDVYSAWVDACDQRSDGEAAEEFDRDEEDEEEDIDEEEDEDDELADLPVRRHATQASSSRTTSKQARQVVSSEDELSDLDIPKAPTGDLDELDSD